MLPSYSTAIPKVKVFALAKSGPKGRNRGRRVGYVIFQQSNSG